MTPHWTGRCRLLISSHSKVSGQLSPGEQKIVMKVQIIIFWKPFLGCDADVTMWPFLKDGNVTDPFGGGGDMAILRVRRIYCIGHRPSSLHCQEHQQSSTSSLNWTIFLYLVSNARGVQLPWNITPSLDDGMLLKILDQQCLLDMLKWCGWDGDTTRCKMTLVVVLVVLVVEMVMLW